MLLMFFFDRHALFFHLLISRFGFYVEGYIMQEQHVFVAQATKTVNKVSVSGKKLKIFQQV